MRIVHLTDLYEPIVGGTERHVQLLAAAQQRRGDEAVVVTFAHPDRPLVEDHDGVVVRRVDGWTRALRRWSARPGALYHPTAPDPGLVATLTALVRRERPDVVHAHGWIGFSGAVAAQRVGAPFVWALHDYGAVCAIRTYERGPDHRCSGPSLGSCLPCSVRHYGPVRGVALATMLRSSRGIVDRADLLLTNSTFVADTLALAGLPRAKLRVVAPYIPPPIARATSLRRPAVVPARGDYLLYVGALSRHKGLPTLLEAYERLQLDAAATSGTVPPLVLLGSRVDEAPRLLPDGVSIHADVPHAEVLDAWDHATFGIVPSVWPEPFGLVAVEAAAAGVPVIASRVGGLPEIVRHGVTGLLVEPGDATALAETMGRLLADPERRTRMGEEARRWSQRFDGPNELLPIYAEVTADRRRGTAVAFPGQPDVVDDAHGRFGSPATHRDSRVTGRSPSSSVTEMRW